MDYANEFLLTGAAQKNRNHFEQYVQFEDISFAMEEIMFDPQTSGGLLMAVKAEDAENLLQELCQTGLPAKIVGDITERKEQEIFVKSCQK